MGKKIKISLEEVQRTLSYSEALGLLETHLEGRKPRVHSFTGGGFALFGCDIDLSIIKKRLKVLEAGQIQLAGENMTSMGHGLAYWDENNKEWVFLSTNKILLNEIHKKRGIK